MISFRVLGCVAYGKDRSVEVKVSKTIDATRPIADIRRRSYSQTSVA